jgi:D-tyrosyl-tRNA(Tyr) deacylase
MRAVVQRVLRSAVSVEGQTIGAIGQGLTVLLGVARQDTLPDADYLAEKIIHLRIFEDENGKMNRSLADIHGAMLVVSQFTLLGDCRKGRRPSFVNAADPEAAEALYLHFAAQVKQHGIPVATGRFRAMMQVDICNDGPVTLILDSGDRRWLQMTQNGHPLPTVRGNPAGSLP